MILPPFPIHLSILLISLTVRFSHNYAATHIVVEKLNKIDGWTADECEEILKIVIENSQVRGVLNDGDVKAFLKKLIDQSEDLSENMKKISEIIS